MVQVQPNTSSERVKTCCLRHGHASFHLQYIICDLLLENHPHLHHHHQGADFCVLKVKIETCTDLCLQYFPLSGLSRKECSVV